MKKTTILAFAGLVVVIAGAIFASAALSAGKAVKETQNIDTAQEKQEATTTQTDDSVVCGVPGCGTGACDYDCGGNCGVPSCGCSR